MRPAKGRRPGLLGENFLYGFKAALTGRARRRSGRIPAAPLPPAAGMLQARGRRAHQQGRHPRQVHTESDGLIARIVATGRAGHRRRRTAGARRAGRPGGGLSAGCGYGASGGGAQAPGWPGTAARPAGCWVVTGRHPVTAAPGAAEQTAAGPASVGGHVQTVGRWRPRPRPAPRRVGRRRRDGSVTRYISADSWAGAL